MTDTTSTFKVALFISKIPCLTFRLIWVRITPSIVFTTNYVLQSTTALFSPARDRTVKNADTLNQLKAHSKDKNLNVEMNLADYEISEFHFT